MILFVVLTGLCLGAFLAEAEPAPAAESDEAALTTEEVVVSATKTAETIARLAAPVTVITRDAIDRTPYRSGHQVDDLLRFVPGVQPSNLSSRYNHPTAQAVTMHGLGARRTLVLLDGVPLNDGFGGWINWGLVPDRVQRVEVVPGGASNLYGTWAMGGVIHIVTEEPRPGAGLRVDSQAGNLSTYTNALTARYGTDRLGIILGYRWFHSNGYITVPPDQRGPIDRSNDSRHEHLSGAFSAALDSSTTLKLSGSLFREDRTFGTPLSLATRTIGTMSLGLVGDRARGDRYEITLFGQWQTFRNLTSQITPAPTLRLGEFRDRIQTIPSNDFGGSAQWMSRIAADHTLLVGADARTIIAQSAEDLFTATGPIGHARAKGQQLGLGLFGEWIYTPTKRFSLIPSVRGDWWRNFGAHTESPGGAVAAPPDKTVSVINPKLAAQYRVADALRVGVCVYQAFRAPTLNELYRSFGFGGFTFASNERLSPERLTGAEAKLEGDLGAAVSWRITGHYDEVKDQILFVTEGPFLSRRQNVGHTRARGGEGEITWRTGELISVKAGYAYTDSTITSFPSNPAREGKQVPNVSMHQIVLGVTVGHMAVIEATVLARYLSRQYADDANQQPIADFVVLDATIRKGLGKGLQLFLNGENLTDHRYIATQTGPIKTLGAPLLVMGGVRWDY